MIKDYQKLSDQLLLQECRRDNRKAYEQLFERYFSVLYDFSNTYIKNNGAAEELVMDLMFSIWQKRHQIEIHGEAGPYLFRALKNMMFNFIRKKELNTTDIGLLPEQYPAEGETADHQLNCKELQQVYELKLSQLSPQRQKIFRMSRDENMTYMEIAKNMGLSVNTIKTQMLVSLKYFRENLKDHTDITILLVLALLIC